MSVTNTYLSLRLSALENARIMADTILWTTEAMENERIALADPNADRPRILSLAASAGMIAFGALLTYTRSLEIGGLVICAATIPFGIALSEGAKYNTYSIKFFANTPEMNSIILGVTQLFKKALNEKLSKLKSQWNNRTVHQVAISPQDAAKNDWQEMLQTYDNRSEQKTLIAYAEKILNNISESVPKDFIDRHMQIKDPINDLRKICTEFISKDFLELVVRRTASARKYHQDSKILYCKITPQIHRLDPTYSDSDSETELSNSDTN